MVWKGFPLVLCFGFATGIFLGYSTGLGIILGAALVTPTFVSMYLAYKIAATIIAIFLRK